MYSVVHEYRVTALICESSKCFSINFCDYFSTYGGFDYVIQQISNIVDSENQQFNNIISYLLARHLKKVLKYEQAIQAQKLSP
jgi:hypothetical protein